MSRIGFALAAVMAFAVATPAEADAQRPIRQQQERDRTESDRQGDVWDVITGRTGDSRDTRDSRRTRDARDRRDDRDGRAGARGGGPPFCQNGQGHPVFGQQWCRDKGFGDGRGRSSGDLGDIILRPRRDSRLDQGGLIDVLGDVVFGRVQERNYALGGRGPLAGTWLAAPGGGRMLSVRSGNLTIAEFIDSNLDGYADLVRLRRQR